VSTLAALITAYHRTDANEFSLALRSLVGQTRPADEIVVVFDGPVSDAVRQVVAEHDVVLIETPENRGAGPASQTGIEAITADYVARLDSDDAAKPERFAVQVAFLDDNPQVGAVGTAVEEFERTPGDGGAVRRLPENPASYVRINSPLNNPSVMLRASAVAAVGGYQNIHFMEDYDLFARMLAAGWQLHNLPEPLTYFRVSPAQFERRTGREMLAAEREMQANLVSYGLVSPWRARVNLAARTAYRLLPKSLLTRVYAKLFHRGG